jgi:chemotaxis protein MotB
MARKRNRPHVNHERWLVSYADFITLLFAFFVVMYAASQVDKKKMIRVAASIEGAFQQMGVFQGQHPGGTQVTPEVKGPGGPAMAAAPELSLHPPTGIVNIDPLKTEIAKALEEEIKKKAVTVRTGPDGLVISLSELGFFDSGSAHMRENAEASFHRIAQVLAAQKCDIRVEGHTDNVPIRTPEYRSNWDLSTARAVEVVKALIDRYQFEPVSLSAAGYGEYHPLASNDTPAGRQQNRRVDLVVLSQSGLQHGTPEVTGHSALALRSDPQPTAGKSAVEPNQ